jgi:radical SAM protein with 4Fe4S-binding SPASM domain
MLPPTGLENGSKKLKENISFNKGITRMDYFRFASDCHYVKGSIRGALYIITTGTVIHFSVVETEIVNCWLVNERIDKVERKYPRVASILLNHLISEGFGFLYSTPVYSQPYEPYQPFFKLDEAPPLLKNVFLQLTDRCNASCLFCGNKNYYVSRGCITCLRWNHQELNDEYTTNGLDNDNIDLLLKQLACLETQVLSFSGGNPLLDWAKLVKIVKRTIEHRPSTRFLVHTNGFEFNREIAKDAKKLNIGFNFTVFSDSHQGYQKITGSGELFDSLLSAIEICKTHHIIYAISVLVSPDSRQHYDKICQFAQGLGGALVNYSEVFPKTDTNKPMVSLSVGEKSVSSFNPQEFVDEKDFSKCLNGIIAVSQNGMILPCSMWIEPIAIIPEKDLYSIFRNEKHKTFWKMNKSKVPTCGICEFRFICNECALTEHYRKEDPAIHNAVCTYNPDNGEWISR